MHRRIWLAASLRTLAAAALVACGVRFSPAEEQPSLHDRLKAGLKCRQPDEFAFVANVAELVEQGKLTPEMVLGTFRWAVEQRPNFPFYYFQYALKRRAAAIGVDL